MGRLECSGLPLHHTSLLSPYVIVTDVYHHYRYISLPPSYVIVTDVYHHYRYISLPPSYVLVNFIHHSNVHILLVLVLTLMSFKAHGRHHRTTIGVQPLHPNKELLDKSYLDSASYFNLSVFICTRKPY